MAEIQPPQLERGAETEAPTAQGGVGKFASQQADRLVVSNLFRAECHGTAARFFSNVHVFVGALAAGLAAVAGGSAFTGNTTLAGVLGLLSAAFAGLLTALRPDERSQLHWKAAGEYFKQADDVYMTFRAGRPDDAGQDGAGTEQTVTPERLIPPGHDNPTDDSPPTGQSDLEPLLELRASQESFHRLEAVGPPVPRRLERKTKQWVRDDQEWFPPQYDKFIEWWEEKQTGATGGPIRRFFGSIKRAW